MKTISRRSTRSSNL